MEKTAAKKYQEIAERTEEKLRKLLSPQNFFGPLDWLEHHPGLRLSAKIAEPDWIDLEKKLSQRCRLSQGSTVGERYFFFFVPEIIGAPLNLERWQKLYPRPKEKNETTIHFRSYLDGQYRCWYCRSTFVSKGQVSRWHLAYPYPVTGSHGRSYDDQRQYLPFEHEVPAALDAVAMHLLYSTKNKHRLNEYFLGRTSDFGDPFQRLTVGRFGPNGLCVNGLDDDDSELEVGLFGFKKIKQSLQ